MRNKKWVKTSLLVALFVLTPILSSVGATEGDSEVELIIRGIGPEFIAKNNGDEIIKVIATLSSDETLLWRKECNLDPQATWWCIGRHTPVCLFRPITATLSAGTESVTKTGFQFLFWAMVF